MAQDTLNLLGKTIDEKYRFDAVVGEGGFSVVYRAQHLIWQQPVAIKCFKVLVNAPEDQRQKLLDGFVQEGKLMSELSSRSAAIVQARDIGTLTSPSGDWIPYMVLEWLEGKPLDVVLEERVRSGAQPWDIADLMRLLDPAAIAIEVAHRKNVAHRDLKPANFLVMSDTRAQGQTTSGSEFTPMVKVLDFGIAKVMADHANMATALSNTGTEVTAFTPNYGAPEQFSRSHGATGPWTDVFAMALIIVEMLRGGEAALEGDDYLQLAVASRDPQTRPTPRRFGVPVSDAVEAVMYRALAVAPRDRFPTMGEFWKALSHAAFPGRPTWTAGSAAGMTSEPDVRAGTWAPQQTGPSTGTQMMPGLQSSAGPMSGSPGSMPHSGGPHTGMGVASSQQPASRSRAGIITSVALLAVCGLGAAAWFSGIGRTPAVAEDPAAEGSASAVTEPTATAAEKSANVAQPPPCPEGMSLIDGGRFFQGSDEDNFPLWQPAHKVTLSPYCMDNDEVTAGEYKSCSDRGDCKRAKTSPDYPKSKTTPDALHAKNIEAFSEFCNFGKPDRDKHPINCVTWGMADNYCRSHGGRLPTESEWEYAARGSDGRKFPWGDAPGDQSYMNACGSECNAWERERGLALSQTMYEADDGYPGTAPVGTFIKGKTDFGMNDMVGNVWEWTADWFEEYKPGELADPKGPAEGERKVIRGGGFNGGVQLWVNPAFRYHQEVGAAAHGIGFRCAADPQNKP